MTKNEIIDAVLACNDVEGITSGGVFVEKFKVLCRSLPAEKDAVAPDGTPDADVAPVAAPEPTPEPEPVVEPVAKPVVPAPVEAPVEPAVE